MKYGGVWKKAERALTLALVWILSAGIWTCCTYFTQAEEAVQEEESDPAGEPEGNEMQEAPTVALDEIENDAGMTATDEEGRYLFRETLTVQLRMTGEQPFLLTRDDGAEAREESISEDIYTDVITDGGTYRYTVTDQTGHVCGQSVEICASRQDTAPRLSFSYPDTAVVRDAGVFFRSDPDIIGTIADALGIARIEYARAGEAYRLLADYAEADGMYRSGFTSYEDSLRTGSLEEELTGAEDGAYQYCFRVTNVLGCTAEAEAGFIVDRVPPVLEVDYGNGVAGEDGRIYYCTDGEVKLSLREAYYGNQLSEDGTPVLPVLILTGEHGETAEAGPWTAAGEDLLQTTIRLPGITGKEASYRFTLQYRDGSGNGITAGDASQGSVREDVFMSPEIVVDRKAPRLTAYQIDGDTDASWMGQPIYKNNPDGADVTVTFAVEDHAEYWDAGKFVLQAVNTDTGDTIAELSGEQLAWVHDGSIHLASYEFDGEEHTEAVYQIRLSYTDRAGNQMEKEASADETFILDHKRPIMEISCSEAYQVVDGGGVTVEDRKLPLEGHTAYYGAAEGEIRVTVRIVDPYGQPEEDGLHGFSLQIDGIPAAEAVEWKQEGDLFLGTCRIAEEGDHIFSAEYRDPAGNEPETGAYTSPLLVLDTTPPVLSRSYGTEPVERYGFRHYFDAPTSLLLVVEDQNIRYQELREVLMEMSARDFSGKDLTRNTEAWETVCGIESGHIARGVWKPEIRLATDANYTIPLSFTDLAGNQAYLQVSEQATVDTTPPSELAFTYSVHEPVNYLPFGWLFSRGKMTVQATARDAMAGIRRITFVVTDEDGKEITRTEEYSPCGEGDFSVEIPLSGRDFKGTVRAEAYDYAGNGTEQTRGHVVESDEQHAETGNVTISTQTAPSRIVGGQAYYNTDLSFNLTIRDDYAGIRSYACTGGNTLRESRDYAGEAGQTLDGQGTQEIVHVVSRDLTLDASRNNENGIIVAAEYTDNAGHTGQTEQVYHIDVTDPVITVEWDRENPKDGRYYDRARTATVTVQERNFSAEDVEFAVTNTDGAMPVFGEWSSSGEGDDARHVCQITFDQDGDYTFTLSFQDLAGNRAAYDRVDTFTIDRTPPKLTVSWNHAAAQNGFYYGEGRTAVVEVLEHNFDPSQVIIAAESEGMSLPTVSAWMHNGDHHTASVAWTADGAYTFAVSGQDSAGNLMETYGPDAFVVDQTPPSLEIFGVLDRSANNGEVMPGIRCRDEHYDPAYTKVTLRGYAGGETEIAGSRQESADGMEMRLEDFAHVREMDDLYVLEAAAGDLAGNRREAQIVFSVNRFGSVYTFDAATEALVGEGGAYYTGEPQDVVVTETNVDSLEFREITCSLDGEMKTLEEGQDYTVEESGTDTGWKQYTYTVPKTNFQKEGTYLLTIYSEDRADNTSDNRTKGKGIRFAVDKTPPSILISGVEDGGQYREHSRQVTLDVQDNICLEEVTVRIDGKERSFSAGEIAEADGRLTVTVEHAGHWQELQAEARDAAGNRTGTDPIRFLVTPNFFVQMIRNRTLALCVLSGLCALTGLACRWYAVWRGRRVSDES